MTAIEGRSLTRSFGEEVAVDAVDIEVSAGEIVALVGLNGAGKTTLMRLILGMLKPDDGVSMLLGRPTADATAAVWQQVGHLIDSSNAYPELSVRENLVAAAVLHRTPRPEVTAATAIEDFGLSRWSDRPARVLSLGNMQRLGLAAALGHQPSILILDEPANALDPAGVVFVRELIQERARGGAAVLVSSHHFDQLARIAHRIVVMHRGSVVGLLDAEGPDIEQAFFEMVHAADISLRVPTG